MTKKRNKRWPHKCDFCGKFISGVRLEVMNSFAAYRFMWCLTESCVDKAYDAYQK